MFGATYLLSTRRPYVLLVPYGYEYLYHSTSSQGPGLLISSPQTRPQAYHLSSKHAEYKNNTDTFVSCSDEKQESHVIALY